MIVVNENFVLRRIYNVSLLIPVKRNSLSNDVIFLNDTASLIFQYSNETENINSLAKQVFEKFVDVDEDEIIPELEEYIKQLISEGFLIER